MLTKSWKVWHWEKRQAETICKSSLTQVCLSKKSLDLTESNSVRDLELALDFLHERTAGVPIFPCERSCPGWLTIGLEPLLHVAQTVILHSLKEIQPRKSKKCHNVAVSYVVSLAKNDTKKSGWHGWPNFYVYIHVFSFVEVFIRTQSCLFMLTCKVNPAYNPQ